MARNYKSFYESTNDSSALEQAFYLKKETTKGTLIAPAATDFLFTLSGGSIKFNQPFETSPHRSGRHNLSTIKKKKVCSWNLTTYFNIDETLGAASSAEIDAPVRQLWKSVLGNEDLTSGAVYSSLTTPDETFTIMEVGDKWSRQARGAFVMDNTIGLPGNGEATCEWNGGAVESFMIGIGKSVVDNSANTVTVAGGEGDSFRVGGLVMIILADGTTRSSDTPAGSARVITAISGDVITLSGAVLTDADGSAADIYLCYYEPAAKTAINNPLTGLVGSMLFDDLPTQCFRSATIKISNDHEMVDYCYGHDSLDAPFFVPANRLTVTVTTELNLNANLIKFLNRVQDFQSKEFQAILGSSSGRRMVVYCPSIKFPVPEFSVPESGSIPVSLEGVAYQTSLDAANEITVSFI
ncbi:hypothetical protein UFOVP901_34 [uncultured Caudovirales phage]|uniref:Uncharacterized protein n=1 Tax=uncultured Caudovirales phage TaxID=2100421 RepID=A0A6J5PRB1_9CAUD|nr:hypothetical protein UFOVP901_34 [uncultured Caudovirales phage]